MLSPSVCSADFVTFLQVAQLCLRDITSAPLLWSSSQCAGIPLTGLLSQPAELLQPSRRVFVHSTPCCPPADPQGCLRGLVCHPVLKVTMLLMFCAWCRDLCFVSDVLSNRFLIGLHRMSLLVEILPRPSLIPPTETRFSFISVFCFFLLICFPLQPALWARWVGLWLNTFFSVFEKCSPFLGKYLSFQQLKLQPWNKKWHLCDPVFMF